MTRTPVTLVTLIALAAGASACATRSGAPIPAEKVASVQRGATTSAEVHALFGPPGAREPAADGGEVWSYGYYQRADRLGLGLCDTLARIPGTGVIFQPRLCLPTETRHDLELAFDAGGVVRTLEYASREERGDVRPTRPVFTERLGVPDPDPLPLPPYPLPRPARDDGSARTPEVPL